MFIRVVNSKADIIKAKREYKKQNPFYKDSSFRISHIIFGQKGGQK